jgi:hypothetical protein
VGADEGHTWIAARGDEVGFAGDLVTRAQRRAAGDGNCFGYGAAPADWSKLKTGTTSLPAMEEARGPAAGTACGLAAENGCRAASSRGQRD